MIQKEYMRLVLCLAFVMVTFAGLAQDPDVPDNRSKKDNFSKMREKDIRYDLASFTFAGIDESMGKGVLKSIPTTGFGTDFMTFEGNDMWGNSVKVSIKAGKFLPAKHKLAFYEEKHLLKIDNKPYYGNFGKVPRTTIESVIVVIGKDTVDIPATAFSDLYDPTFSFSDAGVTKSFNGVYLSPDKQKIYIYMLNKESMGSYEVTWVIQDKKYLRRVVDFGLLK